VTHGQSSGAARIEVARVAEGEPLRFEVTVREGASETRHRVNFARADRARLCAGHAPERAVEAAFRFLLDREPKESILAHFDVSAIARYFPEFEAEFANYLER
jgi:hypothetical protein